MVEHGVTGGTGDTSELSREDRIKLVLGKRKVEVGGDSFNEATWHELLYDRLAFIMEEAAANSNFPKEAYQDLLKQNWANIIYTVDRAATASFGVNYKGAVQADFGELEGSAPGGPSYQWIRDVGTIMALDQLGLDRNLSSINWRPKSKPTGGGGSGRAVQSFDRAELGEVVNSMWRSYLLESNPNAAALVNAYISVAQSNPDQRVDFQTFVLGKIRQSGRYASIYRNKPDSMDEGQYLSPYMETASQYVRPKNVADYAISGAQFGVDPAAYRSRLGRSNEVQTSAPYITQLESLMRDVSGVLRG
jgi:hypothetical protein